MANTASVYEAFLKKMKRSAQNTIELKPLPIIISDGTSGVVYKEDSNILIKKIKGDILYMDPPYNSRKYNTNYHILETIAYGDMPEIKGKTGVRCDGSLSSFNSRQKVLDAFEDIVKNAKFKYIFLSYNDEGLMKVEDIQRIMEKYGRYRRYERYHKRYKASKNKEVEKKSTIEFLHALEKNDFNE